MRKRRRRYFNCQRTFLTFVIFYSRKSKRVRKYQSRGEKALDDRNIDLESVPLSVLRQHKPRKVVTEGNNNGKAVIIDHHVLQPPASPYSIPPPSPCKTPSLPVNSPRRRPSNTNTPNTPGSDIYYYDLNLNCTTRGERRLTETENTTAVIEIIPPKSVEMIHEDDFNGQVDRKPLRPIVVKQEVLEPKGKNKVVAKEQEEDPEAEEDSEEDDDESESENLVDGLDLSNLVVLEALDELGEKTFNVHFMDKETDEISAEPLDLPEEVIEYIVEAHQKTQQAAEE